MDCCNKKSNVKNSKKSSKSHLMMFGCIALIVILIISSYFFNFKGSYLTWILLAACIGMHFFMKKGHNH